LASASELVILAGLVGDGTTGDLTGITMMSSITTTLTYPTAESSSITTLSIASAGTSITLAGFMPEADFRVGALAEIRGSMDQSRSMDSQPRNTDPRHRISSLVAIPAHSVALITEESPEDSPLAGSRASAVAFMAAEVSTGVGVEAFTVAEAAGNPVHS
jgi:hypothetical protein